MIGDFLFLMSFFENLRLNQNLYQAPRGFEGKNSLSSFPITVINLGSSFSTFNLSGYATAGSVVFFLKSVF